MAGRGLHPPVDQSAALRIADIVERDEMVGGELHRLVEDRHHRLGRGGGEAVLQFAQAGGAQRRLVLGGDQRGIGRRRGRPHCAAATSMSASSATAPSPSG